MKTKLLIVFVLIFGIKQNSQAQFWKKIKQKIENKVDEKVDKKIDDVLNGKNKKNKKKKSEKKSDTTSDKKNKDNTSTSDKKNDSTNKQQPKVWRNFKFIPGEKVIFYDDLKHEEVGEFPSRWDLLKGGSEVATLNKEKVIIPMSDYDNKITPLFKNSNYLGDEFTIEFDIYIGNLIDTNDWHDFNISLFNETYNNGTGNNVREDIHFQIRNKQVQGFVSDNNNYFNFETTGIDNLNDWHHIAISYYKRKLKIYFDEKRIVNLPNFRKTINSLILDIDKPYHHTDGHNSNLKTAIKNIRIAHGGGQMYKRIMADGKYVTNGILFDSGKATIKPQSMGIINKMVSILKEKTDWSFKIIGHTDSDGNDANNLTLSKKRAEAVKQAIVAKGISSDRLTTKGKGETEPLNTNSTKEEKANNRRVEFIKK